MHLKLLMSEPIRFACKEKYEDIRAIYNGLNKASLANMLEDISLFL